MAQQLIRETIHEDWGQFFSDYTVLHEKRSNEQHLLLIETKSYGKVLLLDGIVQVTEKDNFVYHEMLTHVPILAHGECKKVLVIGGGDGGMIHEVLKHPEIDVTMVEIDQSVIDFAKEYLREICGEAFEDERTNLIIGDGAKYVAETNDRFDVIIVDSTDPVGPGEVLFTKEFYHSCKRSLNKNGILVTQNGIPFTQSKELHDSISHFKNIFMVGTCYLGTVPTYVGGEMAFGFATDNEAALNRPISKIQQHYQEIKLITKYYTPELHKASFILPRYIEDIIAS